jgi:hypothetical protein
MRAIASALIASFVAAGCSAAGVPISQPEYVKSLATTLLQSELEAIAWSIRDVMVAAVPNLLRAPPGPVMQQLTAAGTMTFRGTAAQPSDTEETLTLTVAYDGYETIIKAAVAYTDWRLSSPSPSLPTLTIDFTDEPTPGSHQLGYIGGSFAGTVALARGKSSDSSDNVDARLTLQGQLAEDATGKVMWQVFHISGVIYSPAFDYYYNDATFPNAGK